MSQGHAVLGLVIERPGYGYEIAARVQERCPTWEWAPSGVYGHLDALAKRELVRVLGAKSAGETRRGPPRTTYEATDEGRRFFASWMHERCAITPQRDALDLKIQLATAAHLPELIEETERQEQVCVGKLADLARGTQIPSGPVSSWPVAASILQRNREIKVLQGRIEWLQEIRQAMRAILEGRLS